MSFRTDLALESLEHTLSNTDQRQLPAGVSQEMLERSGFPITKLHIATEDGAHAVGKPIGTYFSLDLQALIRREEDAFARACDTLSQLLQTLLLAAENRPILVVGLGNRSITPDAIGPTAVEHILATRHLIHSVPAYFSSWRPVCAVSPGVLGQTGIEVGELVCGLMDKLKPAAVIAVDALASSRLSRLSRTIQISDAGIIPGSGVGNARFALTQETLGVPVIAVGVPTVVDGSTLAHEILHELHGASCEALEDLSAPHVITTRDIDAEVQHLSRVIGYSVNLALHPSLTISDIDLFLS